MWEKYLAERVLPSFRVSVKNDRKSLTYAFGGKFLSDTELSHQLTKRPSWLRTATALSGARRNGSQGARRLTRGYQGASRLTRDSRNRRLTRDFHTRPKIGFFIVKLELFIVKMIRRKFPKFSYM